MQKIKIDFNNPGLPQHISAVENDSQSRFFQATLCENGKAYTAPAGASYSIMYRGFGPQNQGWYDTIKDGAGKRAACAVSGNVVTCEIARQALQVPGHVSIVLCVTTGKGYMLKSWPIECDCKNDRYDSTVEIQSFFYITQVSNADWNRAIQAWENLKDAIDPTLSISGKAADAAKAGEAINAEAERAKGVESQIKGDLGEIDNAFFDTTTTTEELVNTNPIVEDGKTLYTSTYITIQEQSNSSIATLTNVVVGETLYISSTVANTKTSWGFTFTDDRNKTIYHYYDESLSGLADKTNIEVTVPEGATKLYVSRLSSKGNPEVFRKKAVKHKAPKSNLIDVLHGKKLVVFGDSMAYGHTIPESVWTKLLAEKHGMILTNFAQNGTTITRKTTIMSGMTFLDTDSVHAKVMNNLNNPVEADYIIVFGGTNDIARNDQCPLGTIDDATSQTFYGALNAICQRLIQTYPSGNICFITPYIRNAGLANTEVCKQYIKAIHDVCEKCGGIPVFDNSVNGGVDFSNTYQIKALTMQDSYHLNEAGHLRAMHKYEVFLQSL